MERGPGYECRCVNGEKEDAGVEEGGAGCLVVAVVVEGGVHLGPPDVGAATYIIMLFYDVWFDVLRRV